MPSAVDSLTMTLAVTGRTLFPTHHTNTVCALACHPNGQQIATADYDGTVIIRDRVSGAILSFMRDCGPITQLHWDSNSLRVTRGNPAQSVQAIHPEGTIRAQGYDNAIRLYDRRSGRRIGRIRAHNGAITALNFLPNGLLVTAGEDERIAYWDIHTGQQISNMLYTGLMVTAAAVSHDGDTLVAALRHGPDHYGLAAISSENGELLGAPITLDSAITALSAHPLQPIVAYTKDGKVYHLCLPAGAATVSPYFSENSSGISALAYSPDGNTLAAGIHGHLVVDPPLSTRTDNQQRINDIAWHPKQPLIATSGHDSTVIIRNWSDNSVVHLSAKNSSRSGPLVWIHTDNDTNNTILSAHDTMLISWNMATRQPVEFPSPHSAPITAVAASRTSSHFLSCDEGGAIVVWTVDNPHPIFHITSHIGPITAAISHPSRPYFTTCGLDGRLVTRHWESGDILWETSPYLRVED